MARPFYTLIFVPHARAQFRKFKIPVKYARWGAGTAAALAIGSLGMAATWSSLAAEVHELREVRAQNETLRAQTEEFQHSATRLRVELAELKRTVGKLGVMAGLEDTLPEGERFGLGGATGLESLPPSSLSLGSAERTVEELVSRSQELETFYEDQQVLLASTPSIWPVRGYLSSRFGNRKDPFTGTRDFHPGIDISTPHGSAVKAPAEGVIVATRKMGGYGNAIVMNHGYGTMTRYGHLSSYNVKPGQRVKRGDVIGFVGSTGRSSAPHLHYEVWVRDRTQDPIHFILDEYRTFG
jgi:murein DD-endopeptidase MepM/ murein hydrolase activator NlpD